jgi:hypothetical protein
MAVLKPSPGRLLDGASQAGRPTATASTLTAAGEPEESLVVDARAALTPSQVVAGKLRAILETARAADARCPLAGEAGEGGLGRRSAVGR